MGKKDSRARENAEMEYGMLQAEKRMPLLGGPISPAEYEKRLAGIHRQCPDFYPASIELATRRLARRSDRRNENLLDEGFRLMLEESPPDSVSDSVDSLCSNLEGIFRFDLSLRYTERMLARSPDHASLKDAAAYACARLGRLDEAIAYSTGAVGLDPEDGELWSNHGWFHLLAGNLKEAGTALKKARRLDPGSEYAKNNLEAHAYLEKHGGTYLDYLLRPPDRHRLDRLLEDDELEQVISLCIDYNNCRIEALRFRLMPEDPREGPKLQSLIGTLREFTSFVTKVIPGDYILLDDIEVLGEYFRSVMHKFILKFSDVDRELIDEIYESLSCLYKMLRDHHLVSARDLKEFRHDILGMKDELIDKMDRYREVRHDDNLDEEDKEAIRQELFEGDHLWPFI